MQKNILIVSDKLAIYEPIWLDSAAAGYEPKLVNSYQEAGRIVLHTQPSAVIMDSYISAVSAVSLLNRLRSSLHTRRLPVIVVASKDYENEYLPMFEAGADDVVSVPFSVLEFFARLEAVTRPRALRASLAPISVGALTLDLESRRAFVRHDEKDIEVPMRSTAFKILRVLSMRAGSVVTRGEILSSVAGETASVGIRSVDVQIAFLRTVLRRNRAGLQIDAVRGHGYRLSVADEVSRTASAESR